MEQLSTKAPELTSPEINNTATGNIFQSPQHFAHTLYRHLFGTSILCLDLSGEFPAYTEFYKLGSKVRTMSCGVLSDIVVDGDDIKQTITDGLNELCKNMGERKPKLLIIVKGEDFFIRSVETPLLKGDELFEAIKWECAKQIPYKIDNAYIKILDIQKLNGRLEAKIGVILKYVVDQFAFLGDRLLGVVPSPLAAGAHYLGPGNDGDQKSTVVINRGHKEASINIIHNNKIDFCSSFNIVPSQASLMASDYETFLEKTQTSLKNNIDFYYSLYPARQINRIDVHGPDHNAIAEQLAQSTGIEAGDDSAKPKSCIDQGGKSKIPDRIAGEHFLEFGAVKLKADYYFLSDLTRQIINRKKYKSISNVAAIILGTVLFILTAFSLIELSSMTTKIDKYQEQIEILTNSTEYTDVLQLQQQVSARQTIINDLDKPNSWSGMLLRGMSHAAGDGIYLATMEVTRHATGEPDDISIKIEGYYLGELAAADMAVVGFIENLRKYCGFSKTNLERMGDGVEGSRKRLRFTLNGTMKAGQWKSE